MIEAQVRSGLGVAEFAQRRGLNASTMYWWRSRLRRAARREPQIVPVEIVGSRPAAVDAGRPFELDLAGGRRLRVPPHFDADELARLICAVERAC